MTYTTRTPSVILTLALAVIYVGTPPRPDTLIGSGNICSFSLSLRARFKLTILPDAPVSSRICTRRSFTAPCTDATSRLSSCS
ncbi:hypothetical protein PF005_g19039 [Phytophthora fragariae]|uniref:RxLR effector protein n=1 Tax=Phytophthora fragariae TaxID=53985 RepID=A0A6A3SHB5_9STRA|nr:hypothetical protein PF009_g20050 [Phytophthora fragariae]KAE8995206.1 hypothetical protein PF011_g16427 [Phytophthora fragariae]KAE9091336.1 hypothetical protein PF007_g18918 [Phytophthora fragariae]KAE9093820.1 hypothetical protein PF010_g17340 [Phytophthora fragariae]KAE9117062.1 hypothetical protein PF006_g18899 [Phytophthora fragariae]